MCLSSYLDINLNVVIYFSVLIIIVGHRKNVRHECNECIQSVTVYFIII